MSIKATHNKTMASSMNEVPFDLVISNVNLVNIFTKEVYPCDIAITDGKIAHITQPGEERLICPNMYDGSSKYAIPGLIDTHVHTESSMMSPANMAKAIIPHGTTSIACDPHEIGNVAGFDGINYILESSKDIPLNVFVLAPSCVPSALGIETSGAAFFADDIDKMLNNDRVIGLAEVMDFPAVINQGERISDIIAAAKKHNVFLQGHAPMLTGRGLSAYQASGVNSCHETALTSEAEYKLRAGMTVECRESSAARNIAAIMPAIKKLNYPPNATICTDDREADDLLNEGHMDHVVRRCIEEGADVIEVIRMATYNAANLLRLHDRGSLIAGNVADVVLLDDLEGFKVNEVFIKGELFAKDGAMVKDFETPVCEFEKRRTVHIDKVLTKEDFEIKAPTADGIASVNLIRADDNITSLTHLYTQDIKVTDGICDISNEPDIATLSIWERHAKSGTHATCFIKNSGLREGAIASTLAHDCHNLVVIGKSNSDMALAANTLIKTGGGFCCVKDGEILFTLELPIGGLMSPLTVEELAPLTSTLKQKISSMGLRGSCPIIQLGAYSLPVIPNVRLTDMGLVDVFTQKFIPIFN